MERACLSGSRGWSTPSRVTCSSPENGNGRRPGLDAEDWPDGPGPSLCLLICLGAYIAAAQVKPTSDYVFCIRRQVVDISSHSCHKVVLGCTVACVSQPRVRFWWQNKQDTENFSSSSTTTYPENLGDLGRTRCFRLLHSPHEVGVLSER